MTGFKCILAQNAHASYLNSSNDNDDDISNLKFRARLNSIKITNNIK